MTQVSDARSRADRWPGLALAPGRPPIVEVDAAEPPGAWAAAMREELRGALLRHGVVLVRGLPITAPGDVSAFLDGLGSTGMVEREGFAPRRRYADGLYGSSEWPPDQPMCMHHEMSYALDVPGLLAFGCLVPPRSGGATAVADAAAVLEALPGELVARFADGWQLTRRYRDDLGVPWSVAFGRADPEALDDYCRAHAVDHEWLPDGLLTRQRRAAVVRHPVTGVPCWFNQIAFLNEWTLDRDVRGYMVETLGPQGLPFNSGHRDGTPIDEATVRTINDVYEAHTLREPWRAGDLLLVDNIRTAHAREPYSGPRDIVVALAERLRLADHLV